MIEYSMRDPNTVQLYIVQYLYCTIAQCILYNRTLYNIYIVFIQGIEAWDAEYSGVLSPTVYCNILYSIQYYTEQWCQN